MSNKSNALRQVLGLTGDWHVQQIRMSGDGGAFEILVGRIRMESSGWLGQKHWVAVDGPRHGWRHLDFGGLPTYVYAVVDGDDSLFEQPWAAPKDQRFTRAMASYLVELLCSGADLGSICKMHRIDLDTLWRFRFSLDKAGAASLMEPEALIRLRQRESSRRQMVEPAVQSALATPAVPDANAEIWQQIATGELPLQTDTLALRLLLARLRSDLHNVTDPEVAQLKCAKLHRYFSNNAGQLQAELNQLKELAV